MVMSQLGFGLSKLMRVPMRKDRRRILETAFEQGIRHFDVARMYGLGVAEQELGEFVRGKRDQVTIATKFGIDVAGPTRWLGPIQAPVRWLFARYPSLKKTAIGKRPAVVRKHFTPDLLRASLQTSLRMLKTDYVDILFLHEPAEDDYIADDLGRCLEDLRVQGAVRTYGISAYARDVQGVAERRPDLTEVLQCDNDAVEGQVEKLHLPSRSKLLTMAPFASALAALRRLCQQSPEFFGTVASETGVDLRVESSQIRFLLSYSVHANPNGTVVFASTSPGHIAAVAECMRDHMLEAKKVQGIAARLRDSLAASKMEGGAA